MKRIPFLFVLLIAFTENSISQNEIMGITRDSKTNEPIPWTNIQILETKSGTTTDEKGRFKLRTELESVTLKLSAIGYKSRNVKVQFPYDGKFVVKLSPTEVLLSEIVVTPSDSTALAIIRKCIEAKKSRVELISMYKTDFHLQSSCRLEHAPYEGRITLPDLMTNETLGEVAYHDYERFTKRIHAIRRSHTSGLSIDKYLVEHELDMLLLDRAGEYMYGNEIIGPISERGMKVYKYRTKGTTTMDGVTIHLISCAPLLDDEPLIFGDLYIDAEEYSLVRADLSISKMGLLKIRNDPHQTITGFTISQSMKRVADKVWRPAFTQLRETTVVSLLGKKISDAYFDVKCLFGDYRLIANDESDQAQVKTRIDADALTKDSVYWLNNALLPLDTSFASLRDSSREADDEHTNTFHYGSERDAPDESNDIAKAILVGDELRWNETSLTMPGVLSIHSFDRVQGYNVWFPLSAKGLLFRRDTSEGGIGYGFDDKKMKYSLGYQIRLPLFYGTNLIGSIYNIATSLETEHDQWGSFMSAVASIFAKYDYKDYYYTNGFRFSFRSELSRAFALEVYYSNEKHTVAVKNTDWSLLRYGWQYRSNRLINEGKIQSVGISLAADGREFLEQDESFTRIDGGYSHRPRFGIEYSSFALGTDTWDAITFDFKMDGYFPLHSLGTLGYSIRGFYADDKPAAQKLYTFPGTVYYFTDDHRFRTLDYREFGGDKAAQISLVYEFYRGLYSLFPFEALKNLTWTLGLFYNAGALEMREASRGLLQESLEPSRTPFHEVGIRLGKVFSYFSVDAAWRLNHFREGRNVYVGFQFHLPIHLTNK